MVNTRLLGDLTIEGYEDLLNPELKGRIAMCSPSSSSSAWEQLINMLYAMGEGEPEEGWDYVEEFIANLDGVLLESSSEVYQGVADGRFTVGLTFEEGAAHYVAEGQPVQRQSSSLILLPGWMHSRRSAPSWTAEPCG